MKMKKPIEKPLKFCDFEEFSTAKKVSKPVVTLGKRGLIAFNRALLNLCGLSKEDLIYVVIKYSKDKNSIAFNLSSDTNNKNAIKISVYTQGSLSIVSFFKYYDIDLSIYAGNYSPTLIDDEWVISLDDDRKD